MATKTARKTRRRRCSYCEKLKEEVLGKQRLCSDCESDWHSYCKVCDEWRHIEGDLCRHIGWDSGCGMYAGCGTYDIDAADHKPSFMLLLDQLASVEERHWDKNDRLVRRPAMPKILECIEANNFWTQWHGPMIGGPPSLAMYHQKDFGTHKSFLEICDIQGGSQLGWKNIDELQLGMAWLTSLDSKSVKANKLTAGWIREWMQNPGQASKDIVIAKKRSALLGWLGQHAKDRREEIFAALGIPGKNRAELDAVPLDKLRDVVKSMKTALGTNAAT